jgi:hypothetical protein
VSSDVWNENSNLIFKGLEVECFLDHFSLVDGSIKFLRNASCIVYDPSRAVRNKHNRVETMKCLSDRKCFTRTSVEENLENLYFSNFSFFPEKYVEPCKIAVEVDNFILIKFYTNDCYRKF